MRYLSNAVHILGSCTLRIREKLVSEGAVRGSVSVGNAETRKFAIKQLQVEKGQISVNEAHFSSVSPRRRPGANARDASFVIFLRWLFDCYQLFLF